MNCARLIISTPVTISSPDGARLQATDSTIGPDVQQHNLNSTACIDSAAPCGSVSSIPECGTNVLQSIKSLARLDVVEAANLGTGQGNFACRVVHHAFHESCDRLTA